MYEKTANKWNLSETEMKSLMIFYNQHNYRLVMGRIEHLLEFFMDSLENATEPADIYRAQGAKKLYTSFNREMEQIIANAKSEEDGTFDEGEEMINPIKEMMENAQGI